MNQESKSGTTSPAEPVTQNYSRLPENPASIGDKTLSQQQLMAIEAILMGQSQINAANHAGVSRKTLYNWRHGDQAFIAELHHRQEILYQASIDRIRAAIPRAAAILCSELDSTYAPRQIRATSAILALANMRKLIPIKAADE